MTDSKGWGNPVHTTFAKRNIRLVAVDDIQVKVHRVLQPIVEQLLLHLGVQDLKIDHVAGFPDSPAGQGLVLRLAGIPAEAVATAMEQYGFAPDADMADHYVWGAGYEEAEAKAAEIDDAPPEPDAAPEPPAEAPALADLEGWWDGLPGARDLENGIDYAGRDVLFLQAYLGTPRTGVYDPATIAAVAAMKARRGLAADGSMNAEAWKQLLPRMRRKVQHGDNGRTVRLLSAALIAAQAVALDEPVRARYNSALARLVRDWQTETGLRKTGAITSIDWGELLYHPWV